jgi:hypothetical protein
VHVLQHCGAGLAPWNVTGYQYQANNGHVLVNELPLIFFHFHAFLLLTPRLFVQRGYAIPPALRRPVYLAYAAALQAALKQVRRLDPGFRAGFGRLPYREIFGCLRFGLMLWR